MRTIYLYGALAEEFGEKFELSVRNVGEAIRLLQANFPGFANHIRTNFYFISYGHEDKDQGIDLVGTDKEHSQLRMDLGEGPIHIIPQAVGCGTSVPRGEGGGSKGKGTFQLALGIVLLVVGAVVPGGQALIAIGLSLALGGVASLLAPSPSIPATDTAEEANSRESFVFNGPVNTMEQGSVVPVVYGRHIVGSKVISGGIDVEDIS